MTDIINYAIIPDPAKGTRLIIGNLKGTNDIYMKRESLQMDEATKRADMGRGIAAQMGRMMWTEECLMIFPNTFRAARFYHKNTDEKTGWQEAYIRFIKYCLENSSLNYDQMIPFVAGMKIFVSPLAKNTRVFINEEEQVPYKIVNTTGTHYVLEKVSSCDYNEDGEETKTIQVAKHELEETALSEMQVRYRKMYPEYF